MKILKKDYAALTSNAAVTYTANDLNQYDSTTYPTEAFTYDDDGNLTQDDTFDYTWDAENRLIEVQTRIDWEQNSTAYESGDKRVYFSYDYMGRRVRKRVETFNGTSWPETGDELFVYDGWNVVMVLNANEQNEVMREYTWGLDLSGTVHGAGGIGGLLVCYHPTGSNRYWYFYDANGNVGQMLDATSTGNITLAAHYEYDPYGNLINSSGPYKDANPFRFSTKWFDAETHLGYWGYRYYSPRLGRWISRDPIGERGGLNLHRFVLNAPIEKIDPLGAIPYPGVAEAIECCLFAPQKKPPIPPECQRMVARLKKCGGSDHGPFWNSGLCCQLMDFVCKEEKKDCAKDVNACYDANPKGGKSLNPCHFGGHVDDVCWMFEGATGGICKPHWGAEPPNEKQGWQWMQKHLYMFKLCDTVEVKKCVPILAAHSKKQKDAFPKFCIEGKGGKEACYKYCNSTFVPPENQAECISRCDATFVAPQTGPSSAPQ